MKKNSKIIKAWLLYISGLFLVHGVDYLVRLSLPRVIRAPATPIEPAWESIDPSGIPLSLEILLVIILGICSLLLINQAIKRYNLVRRISILSGNAFFGFVVYVVIHLIYALETGIDSL